MLPFNMGVGGSSDVDVGDIGHSLRFRGAQSIIRTITTDATSTYFAAVKRGKLGAITPIFDTNIKFNANDTLTAFGLTTTAVFRDPTSWLFIHVSNGGLYVNGVSYGAVTTSSITNPRIGYDGTNYADMYIARLGVVGGSSSSYTNFGYLNTEINEWVTKTAAQVKAVVDAGGTNSFMLDFNDAASLTTLGYSVNVSASTGTAGGDAKTTTAQFKYGSSSAVFDGTGDYVYFGTGQFIPTTSDFTVEGWIRLNTTGSRQLFLGQISSGATNATVSVLFESNASNKLIGTACSGSTAYTTTAGATSLTTGQWYHVAFVRDGTTMRTYLDGVQQGSVSIGSSSINTPAYNMALGRAGEFASSALNGWLQDFRIYSNVCKYPSGTTFTPPSDFLPSIDSDPNGASVTLAAQLTGANNGTSFPYSFRNNWTLNNFSLTAGTTYDHMLDVPGNSYATLNPLIPSAANITNGNLSSGTTAVRATFDALKFDSKWEVTAGGSAVTAGVISGTGTPNTTSVTANKTFAFRLTTAGALDYKNVTDAGSWTSITTGLSGEQYPYSVTQAANWNFGQAPLHVSATYQSGAGGYFFDTTSGFKALCQANLPDVAILNPEKHFDAYVFTGDGAIYPPRKYSGVAFDPDLVWSKTRNGSPADGNNMLYDRVRGTDKQLVSNSTAAEATFSGINFGVSPVEMRIGVNSNGDTYVHWLWKAGGAAVTNNAGSIASQVGANVEAGFSIVTYTGDGGASATIGHGLNSAPEMLIVKNRDQTDSGAVYHYYGGTTSANGKDYFLRLFNATGTQTRDNTGAMWNDTAPTTTVFSVGTEDDVNASAEKYVAYCFHSVPGYSKIGSYTGNGSADGPYVECGFKPKYVLVKSSSQASPWQIYDAARDPSNVCGYNLIPNSNTAESSFFATMDFTATGFKLRYSGDSNTSGQTYIFYAIADVPGKYSLAR